MKNGLFTTISQSVEKEVEVGEVKHRKDKQRRRSIKEDNAVNGWNWKGPVFYELLPKNKTINSDIYCEQLQKLSDAIAQKRPELINRKGVVFHHDNARPHTSLVIRQKLQLLIGMCYHIHRIVQTLVLSNFHLFRFLQNSLNGKTFASHQTAPRQVSRREGWEIL